MNASLVHLHHDTPVTTSLAVAEGTANEHRAVIQLVRKYADDLMEFGLLAFEMRPRVAGQHGGGDAEFAVLNEQQATLLITYMRNTEVVRRFKKALVAAFFALRDAQRAAAVPRRDEPLSLSHRADELVSADRTFRAMMRTGRTAGLGMAAAIRRAQAVTLDRTGIDMLAELDLPVPQDPPPPCPQPEAVRPGEVAIDAWCAKHEGPVSAATVAQALGLPKSHAAQMMVALQLKARGWSSRKVRERDARGRERQGIRWKKGSWPVPSSSPSRATGGGQTLTP